MRRLSQPTVSPSPESAPFLGVVNVLREMGGPKQPFAILMLQMDDPMWRGTRLDDERTELLLQLASRRARRVVGDCVVARLGARRFAVLLEGPIDEIATIGITARLHEALRAPFEVAGLEVFASTSIGIGLGDWNTEPATVLYYSEQALDRVRLNGGDATAVEPPHRSSAHQTRVHAA